MASRITIVIDIFYIVFQKQSVRHDKKTTYCSIKNICVELLVYKIGMTLKCVFYIEAWLSILLTGITYVGKAWFIYLHKNMSFYG